MIFHKISRLAIRIPNTFQVSQRSLTQHTQHTLTNEYRCIDNDLEKIVSRQMSSSHQSSHFVYGSLLQEKRFIEKSTTLLRKDGKDLKFCFTSGSDVVGHPGCLHGGVVALLFDHAMFLGVEYLIGSSTNPLLTGRLEIDYCSIGRTKKPYELIVRIEEMVGRKIWLRGSIIGAEDHEVVANSRALFVRSK
jgi:acyl-coenzyme A thioesterase PaaI-like protein